MNSNSNDNYTWYLKGRIIKSYYSNDISNGITQFDSLLLKKVNIEPDLLLKGLEMLIQKDSIRKFLNIVQNCDSNILNFIYNNTKFCSVLLENNIECKPEKVSNEIVKKLLIEMYISDQESRGADMTKFRTKYNISLSNASESKNTDIENTNKLKEIINSYGFPTLKMVGIDGMEAIFYLLQHSNSDIKWMESQLVNVEQSVNNGDMNNSDLAYLTDRIMTLKNNTQLYGTQFLNIDFQNNSIQWIPIEDNLNLNIRRKKMNLMPIELYSDLILSRK